MGGGCWLCEKAVRKCRAVADAYLEALRPLVMARSRSARGVKGKGKGKGVAETWGEVVGCVKKLVKEVEEMRKAGAIDLFGESREVNRKLLINVENRCVDAVIKARAAFVNVLDNEFRVLGWPMKVPNVEDHGYALEEINFNVAQLNLLQKVARSASFVKGRTKWHSEISDSWAMAAILRAPLARFKYHFLESYRAGSTEKKTGDNTSTTRFDRPEWAADFALARIAEAIPFLKKIIIADTATADVKFAEGFCQVFADKVAGDCDLAMRGSNEDDTGAERLISHAAATAEQFDRKIHQGLRLNDSVIDEDALPSALHTLSMNDQFFTTWAKSELTLAEPYIHNLVQSLFRDEGTSENPRSVADLEADCIDIVEYISRSSRGCRRLDSSERKNKFVRLTEIPLLQVVRTALIGETAPLHDNLSSPSIKDLFRSARAIWVAHMLVSALREKGEEPFYSDLGSEISNGRNVYSHDIERFENLARKASYSIVSVLYDGFSRASSGKYESLVRFGELPTVDAAVVLAHDLSATLCDAMSDLEARLKAMSSAIPSRKVAAGIWKSVATSLDRLFFEDLILQAFVGARRSAVCAASETNDYLSPRSTGKMARQLGYDASVLVEVFGIVTSRPENFLKRCAQASKLLLLAARKVIRPRIELGKGEEETLNVLKEMATAAPADPKWDSICERAAEVLRTRMQVDYLHPREAMEMLIIAGLVEPPVV
eukprot:Plantae.Rhodophyta-Hildenbrandia_rubra.ctg14468.p1 GENE.Plantae.Rhodophyta-Hildenbrandia_rubra.ctg14468~~Plantae.Rhodophyta-Hildenbrandia_rubra.ctg14468.p1  ORF type:complete len:717 (+),score=142.72 Plantae.Rhodophyta-Hildenbrandia_rubra.ctg14468:84-2234(+)